MTPNLSRRRFLATAGGAAAAAALGSGAAEALAGSPGGQAPHPQTPTEALRLLQKGNWRYRRERLELRDYSPVGERRAAKQQPLAAIVTCADSRISPELVFDVERGNLFVSRIAGNSIDSGTLGSTEYAVGVLGVQLIMVLGHTDCGAVKSAISVVNEGKSYPASEYGAIGEVIDLLVPTVESLPPAERDVRRCAGANAITQAGILSRSGPIIAPAVAAGKLRVVAAVYNIANGVVSVIR
jgi:carbonic anhydrase